jgi:hypothetical protein
VCVCISVCVSERVCVCVCMGVRVLRGGVIVMCAVMQFCRGVFGSRCVKVDRASRSSVVCSKVW